MTTSVPTCFYYINSVIEVQPFEGYRRRRSNKTSKRANKRTTELFVKKVPRHKLTQSVVKTNIEISSLYNEYSCLSRQIEHEHVHRHSQVVLFDI